MSDPLFMGVLTDPDQGHKVVIGITVSDVGAAMQKFGWPDYLVFIFMLLICVAVGLYFGFVRAASSSQDYLVGGRTMPMFPVSMSLIATFISGISLLGIPTEIYVYGIQYIYIAGAIILMAILVEKIYLPVFHELQVTSTYEYLERRFDKTIRLFGSMLFTIGMLVWLPVVIYVPALAFNQVTGVNVHLITPLVCVICIFYTSMGGIKAVVWTDVIQTIVMIGAIILVIIKGTLDAGGAAAVWERNWNSGRIEAPNFDVNPLSRHTVWSLVFGGVLYWLQSSAINQNMIQRYLSLPDFKTARRSLWFFVFGVIFVTLLCSYCGMVIYATYYKCDPLTTMLAREKDQLLPLLVMEVLGDIPGLPGLFVAGIFSAALSSLSTGLNSMAAVVLEDFYKTFFKRKLTEKQTYILMKSTVIIFGIIFVALVYVVEKLGAVLQLSMSVGAIAAGPALSLFTMGLLFPWVHAKGALVGGVSGLAFMSWLCLKAQTAIANGDLSFPEKPVYTDGCHYQFTPKMSKFINLRFDPSLNTTEIMHTDESFMLYRLSYLWYTLIGCTVSMSVALLVSFVTKPNDPRDLDQQLLAPFVRRLIPLRRYSNQPNNDGIIYAYEEPPNINLKGTLVDTTK